MKCVRCVKPQILHENMFFDIRKNPKKNRKTPSKTVEGFEIRNFNNFEVYNMSRLKMVNRKSVNRSNKAPFNRNQLMDQSRSVRTIKKNTKVLAILTIFITFSDIFFLVH